MKYSSTNLPLVCMQTQSDCYKGTTTMTVKGVLWHSTGANNPTLKRYVQPSDVKPAADTYTKEKWLELLGKNQYGNDWNHISRSAGMNCWIGKLANGTVTTVQTMPWNYRPWGCGSGSKGSCNDGWIQFEMCEDGLTDKDYFNKCYTEACEITAYLCKMFNIDPKGTVTHKGVTVPTILCHSDSNKLGLGSNHGDVYNWFNKQGKTMDDVRNDVAKLMNVAPTHVVVKTYELYKEVPVYDTANDAKNGTNSTGTYKAGMYYIYNKYPDGRYGMFNITADKTGGTAGAWMNPADNVKTVSPSVNGVPYQVVTSINRYTTVDDAVNKKNSKGTYEKGTYYIYNKYPNGSNGMFNISTDKTGASAGSWINPSENVATPTPTPIPTPTPVSKKVYELDFPDTHHICEVVTYMFNENLVQRRLAQACEIILKNNPSFDVDIVRAFFRLSKIYCIDPIRAISQSILETGWFKYQGSAVKPEHHNYCGLGVTTNGKPGSIFDTIENGVRAQLQHLYAYGCKDAVPNGETIVDERFNLVTRGIATTWEELAGRWAVPGFDGNDPEASMKNGTTYGQKIDKIYESIIAFSVSQETIDKYFSKDDPKVDPQPTPVEPDEPKDDDNEEIDNKKVNAILDLLIKILNYIVDFFKK